jgi:hypothetical protein
MNFVGIGFCSYERNWTGSTGSNGCIWFFFLFPEETGKTPSAIRPRKTSRYGVVTIGNFSFLAAGDWLSVVASGNSQRQQKDPVSPVDPVYK